MQDVRLVSSYLTECRLITQTKSSISQRSQTQPAARFFVQNVAEDDLKSMMLYVLERLCPLFIEAGVPSQTSILQHRSNDSLEELYKILPGDSGTFQFLKKPESLCSFRRDGSNVVELRSPSHPAACTWRRAGQVYLITEAGRRVSAWPEHF